MFPKYVEKSKENRHIGVVRPQRAGICADAPSEARVGSIDGVEPSEPDAMADLVETYRGAVYPWHCDHVGHMNVMWYVGKFDEATWNFFALLGITPSFLRENRRGMAAVEQRIVYRRELHAGDVVVVKSGVLEVRDKVVRFVHEMRNAETQEISAITSLTGVHMDTAARKACSLPEEVIAQWRAAVVAYELPW